MNPLFVKFFDVDQDGELDLLTQYGRYKSIHLANGETVDLPDWRRVVITDVGYINGLVTLSLYHVDDHWSGGWQLYPHSTEIRNWLDTSNRASYYPMQIINNGILFVTDVNQFTHVEY